MRNIRFDEANSSMFEIVQLGEHEVIYTRQRHCALTCLDRALTIIHIQYFAWSEPDLVRSCAQTAVYTGSRLAAHVHI